MCAWPASCSPKLQPFVQCARGSQMFVLGKKKPTNKQRRKKTPTGKAREQWTHSTFLKTSQHINLGTNPLHGATLLPPATSWQLQRHSAAPGLLQHKSLCQGKIISSCPSSPSLSHSKQARAWPRRCCCEEGAQAIRDWFSSLAPHTEALGKHDLCLLGERRLGGDQGKT